MRNYHNKTDKITAAVLLAAGTGNRLQPLTNHAPKCLAEVNGVSMLERLTLCLRDNGFNRLIIVVGHMDYCIREFLGSSINGLRIDYIVNPQFSTTNNIYSLWLARDVIQEAFLLVESDIVFDASLLSDMTSPDRIAVSRMLPWMNGSTVTINRAKHIVSLNTGGLPVTKMTNYKTVNIYSFSLRSWRLIEDRLERYISTGRVNDYYEAIFTEMIAEDILSFEPVFFDEKRWYEIDTLIDLQAAEQIFPKAFELPSQIAISPEPTNLTPLSNIENLY